MPEIIESHYQILRVEGSDVVSQLVSVICIMM